MTVGWFVWRKDMRSNVICEKIDANILAGMQPPTKKLYDASAVARHPLDAADWELNVYELIKKYPPPKVK